MDLRNLPSNLNAEKRCDLRRMMVEKFVKTDLSLLSVKNERIGHADERNCEQMLGAIGIPVGYAGPLSVQFSDNSVHTVHLPLATTEGALVASVNRGCKALMKYGVTVTSIHHGITRSLALSTPKKNLQKTLKEIQKQEQQWRKVGEATSEHLKILKTTIETSGGYIFLTINCNTDEAMGMNMVSVAAQAIGNWIEENISKTTLITIAANVDSDKKPSKRTYERGRGYEVIVKANIDQETIEEILKTTPEAMLKVADAKLCVGSKLAGALGKNLHAANIIAALYLATGQDIAHVVEGSLTDTTVTKKGTGLSISIRLPAILVGVRGGGISLPAQSQCLQFLLKGKTSLHPCEQLAQSIGAAVLAGELSLLAAQASNTLAKAHTTRTRYAPCYGNICATTTIFKRSNLCHP